MTVNSLKKFMDLESNTNEDILVEIDDVREEKADTITWWFPNSQVDHQSLYFEFLWKQHSEIHLHVIIL